MRAFLKMHFGIEETPGHLDLENRKAQFIGIRAWNLDPLSPVLGIHHGNNLAVLIFPNAHKHPVFEVVLNFFLLLHRRRIGEGRISPEVIITTGNIDLRRFIGLESGCGHGAKEKAEKFHRIIQDY